MTTKEIAAELFQSIYPNSGYDRFWCAETQQDFESAIERLMMRNESPRTSGHYADLERFRDALVDQLTRFTKDRNFAKVAKIASALNVIGDLLNMPAVKAWELPS